MSFGKKSQDYHPPFVGDSQGFFLACDDRQKAHITIGKGGESHGTSEPVLDVGRPYCASDTLLAK